MLLHYFGPRCLSEFSLYGKSNFDIHSMHLQAIHWKFWAQLCHTCLWNCKENMFNILTSHINLFLPCKYFCMDGKQSNLKKWQNELFFIHIIFSKIVGRGVKVVPMLGGGVSWETFRTTQIRRPRPTGVGVEVHEQRSPSRHWKRATVCGRLRRLCINKNVM